MKKLLFISLLILAACGGEPETIVPIQSHQEENASARAGSGGISPMNDVCANDYMWWHDHDPLHSSTSTSWHYEGDISVQYLANGNPILIPSAPPYYSHDSPQIKWRMQNTGTATFRYRINGGSWTTVNPGTSGPVVIWNLPSVGNEFCKNHSTFHFTADVELLSCGTPFQLNYFGAIISVSGGHNFGRPGYVINSFPTISGNVSGFCPL